MSKTFDHLRIIVLGYIVRGPLGGMVWSNTQYLLGLAKLGHEVYFVEDSDDYASCYDPFQQAFVADPSYGLNFAASTLSAIGYKNRWAYFDAHQDQWHGPCAQDIQKICAKADILINLCGVNPLRTWFADIPVRLFVDEDPAFTQIRNITDNNSRERTKQHTHYFSFAENIGTSDCEVPSDGFLWKPTRQPVVTDAIHPTSGPDNGKFTTVMLWKSYPPVRHNNVTYDMKSKTFERFIELPQKVGPIFKLAIGGADTPKEQLIKNGWELCDSVSVTKDVSTYENFIQRSKAEFSVAKQGYIISNSGWFSERSAAYLAMGRPVVTQDTGFSRHIPCGRGLFAVRNIEEAKSAIDEINGHYVRHCRWARELAEEYFHYKRSLQAMLTESFQTESVS